MTGGLEFAIFAGNKIAEKARDGNKIYEQVYIELYKEFKENDHTSTNRLEGKIGRDSTEWYGNNGSFSSMQDVQQKTNNISVMGKLN